MAIEHDSITNAELHEPKGVSSANSGEIYIANGAGSGAWTQTYIYGGIYSITTDAIAISAIGTTAKKLAAFSHNSPYNEVTPEYANDQITILTDGDYFVTFSIAFETNAVVDAGRYKFRVRVNGVESVIGTQRDMSGSSDAGSTGASGILSLSTNDVLTIYVESDDAGSDNIDIDNAALNILLLRAT